MIQIRPGQAWPRCSQCGISLPPDMLKKGKCAYCRTSMPAQPKELME